MTPPPAFVVRVAGLPTSALDAFACPATAARLRELVEIDASLRAESGLISDALYPVIGDAAGSPAKPRLVALRRKIFQGRRPADLLGRVADALPDDVLSRVENWDARAADRERLAGELPDLLREDLAAALPALARSAAHPDLQRGLVATSPSLLADLRRFSAGEPARPPGNRVLGALVRYVTRMAVKTSPRSTFTVSGLGRWGTSTEIRAGRPRSTTELHAGYLTAVIERLAGNPLVAGQLRVRTNPSLTGDGRTLRVLGLPPGSSIVTARATPAIDRCLALARDFDGTLGELKQALRTDGADDGAAGLVDRLAELGVLQAYVPVPDQSPDRPAALVAWLDSIPGAGTDPELRGAIDRLRGLCRLMGAYAAASAAATRVRLLDEITEELGKLIRHGDPGGEPPAAELRRVFFDNAAFPGEIAACDSATVRPVLRDIGALRPMLALYDPNLRLRLALTGLLRRRWGTGVPVPFLELYHEVCRHGEPAPGDGAQALTALNALRSRAEAEFAGLVTVADGVEHVDPRRLRELTRTWPGYLGADQAMGVYAQICPADGPLLVVNAITGGHGRGRGRVRRLAGREDVPTPAATAGQDELLAELDHLFDSSLNSRAAELAYGIDYPGAVPHRTPDRLIPPAELSVVDDPESGLPRLWWPRHGRFVRPVHSGMLLVTLLPPAARFLLDAFGAPAYLLGPRHPVLRPTAPLPGEGQIQAVARLRIGNAVIRRASWTARRDTLPPRQPGGSDAEWMLRLLSWLRGHGIPSRCFVRLPRPPGRLSALSPKEHKPMYVDFTSWFHVLAAQRMLAGPDGTPPGLIQFEELLPGPEEALRIPGGDAHVTEYLFDITEGGNDA